MKLVIDIPEELYEEIIYDEACGLDELSRAIANGTPLPKGHGDLIDRKELEVVPIDITDLPIDRCLMVYLAEDVEGVNAIIEAEKAESEET